MKRLSFMSVDFAKVIKQKLWRWEGCPGLSEDPVDLVVSLRERRKGLGRGGAVIMEAEAGGMHLEAGAGATSQGIRAASEGWGRVPVWPPEGRQP